MYSGEACISLLSRSVPRNTRRDPNVTKISIKLMEKYNSRCKERSVAGAPPLRVFYALVLLSHGVRMEVRLSCCLDVFTCVRGGGGIRGGFRGCATVGR